MTSRALNQAVKRNIHRFPEDFMFQLTESEAEHLVSQNVIPHKKYCEKIRAKRMPIVRIAQGTHRP